MPLFGSASSSFDQDVEKATAENNLTEDWAHIMEICDKVSSNTSTAKECLRAILKRIHNPIPSISLQALTLLDACVNNCGKPFHLEVCSRDFETEARKIITGKQVHVKIAERLKQLIKKWSEGEFKNDPQLSLIPSLYQKLKAEGVDFTVQEAPKKSQIGMSNDPNVVSTQQEEEDIAKAIELSLKERPLSPKSSAIYPLAKPPSPISSLKENRKVRALYDFEAAEDNELTFKAGEIILILDDSDPNWWKGSNQRGEGLFPANFVTSDLSVEPQETQKCNEKRAVQFNESVQVSSLHLDMKDIEINEEKMNRLLKLLHDADPTEEQHDTEELLLLEEECSSMGPLIDQELEKIDKKHEMLTIVSQEFMNALSMYHNLMRAFPPTYGYSLPKGLHNVYNPTELISAGTQASSSAVQQGYPQNVNITFPSIIPEESSGISRPESSPGFAGRPLTEDQHSLIHNYPKYHDQPN